ncbi:hypothetical protein ABH944_009119 [Caballeronia udeis]|uniref:Uncharacterized protein n=1 Tax=Caballeronia udeis TaxID=1232866 RepID=A0ABW8MZD6_9BURK
MSIRSTLSLLIAATTLGLPVVFPWSLASADGVHLKTQSAWANEPSSFAGIALGKPLSMPECPKVGDYNYECYSLDTDYSEKYGQATGTVEHGPDLGLNPYASLGFTLLDSKVSSVFVGANATGTDVMNATITKFGLPTGEDGDDEDGEWYSLIWKGKNVAIEYQLTRDSESLHVNYLPLQAIHRARKDAATANSAARTASKF